MDILEKFASGRKQSAEQWETSCAAFIDGAAGNFREQMTRLIGGDTQCTTTATQANSTLMKLERSLKVNNAEVETEFRSLAPLYTDMGTNVLTVAHANRIVKSAANEFLGLYVSCLARATVLRRHLSERSHAPQKKPSNGTPAVNGHKSPQPPHETPATPITPPSDEDMEFTVNDDPPATKMNAQQTALQAAEPDAFDAIMADIRANQ